MAGGVTLPATLQHHVALDDEAYHLLNEFLEQHFGLVFPAERRVILENRLQQRLRALSLSSGLDYYLLLCGRDGASELPNLATAVTNNETYFFREADQIETLFTEGIDFLGLRGRAALPLRVLSAGCSSGEEAYTVRFRAHDLGFGLRQPIRVDGIDVDPVRVTLGCHATYRWRSLRAMSVAQVERYLEPVGAERFQVRAPFRVGVRFFPGNLVDRDTLTGRGPYDAVFCRNVLIYFSESSLRRAVENLIELLHPGGVLFLGHSESVIGMFPALETVRLGSCLAYRRRA
jgi:chemotaxis protein methyltransferase CheR